MALWRCLVGIFALGLCSSAFAFEFILEQFQDRYPNSDTDELQCQVCHADSGGGSPWNAYGWSLRTQIGDPFNAQQVQAVLRSLEDSDADANGISNLDEILDHFQPGWQQGAVNTITDRDGNEEANVAAPDPTAFPNLTSLTQIDHPAAINNPLPNIPQGSINLSFVEVASGLARPVKAVTAPGINGSLFVVEQAGQIFRVDLTTFEKTRFLDVRSSVLLSTNFGDERGMLGLAFHPNFQNNGLFYTFQSETTDRHPQSNFPNVSRDHVSAIVEYRANDASCNSFIQRTRTILTVDQPQGNHNAGDIAFGPDGMLYIALGDGGAASDEGDGHGPFGNGRDNSNPLGAILRIDVNGTDPVNGRLYRVPGDNPFVGQNGLDEIFAYGFRNPYRFSFDAQTGDLYAGDVGQNDIEEVDLVTSGGNYGWNFKEGSFFFYDTNLPDQRYVSDVEPPAADGVLDDLIDPIAEYDHDDGVSVIGGYVYRGSQIPVLSGRYVFGEFLGNLLFLNASNDINEIPNLGQIQTIRGFGQDSDNELYVLDNDQLFKLQAPGTTYTPPMAEDETSQCPVSEADLCFSIQAQNNAVVSLCL